MKLHHIRNDYKAQFIDDSQIPDHPIPLFKEWLDFAIQNKVYEPTAMCLSTVDTDGTPHSRIVLLKEIENDELTFYTNYDSQKGKNIEHNKNVCLLFFWPTLERQIKVIGTAHKVKPERSTNYFLSRPFESCLNAWASPQSRTIESLDVVEKKKEYYAKLFQNKPMQRPEFWGGYAVKPSGMEFWQGGQNRLHQRIWFTKMANHWRVEKLAP